MSTYLAPASQGIFRSATSLAMALITLAAGVYFGIKAGSNNNAVIQQWMTQDGRPVMTVTSSGSLTGSGSLRMRGSLSGSTLNVDNTVRFGSGIIVRRTQNIGWSIVSSANQACNTTCTNACVFGEDTSVIGSFVDCADATADKCLCAGGN